MKHLKKFNESDGFASNMKQFFWVQHKDGGKAIIGERVINHEGGKDYIYWNFIGSDRPLEEDEFIKYYDIVKGIEQV